MGHATRKLAGSDTSINKVIACQSGLPAAKKRKA